jgi:hypothetical protein
MKIYPVMDWCGLVCIFFSSEVAEDNSLDSNIDETKSAGKKTVDNSGIIPLLLAPYLLLTSFITFCLYSAYLSSAVLCGE